MNDFIIISEILLFFNKFPAIAIVFEMFRNLIFSAINFSQTFFDEKYPKMVIHRFIFR